METPHHTTPHPTNTTHPPTSAPVHAEEEEEEGGVVGWVGEGGSGDTTGYKCARRREGAHGHGSVGRGGGTGGRRARPLLVELASDEVLLCALSCVVPVRFVCSVRAAGV